VSVIGPAGASPAILGLEVRVLVVEDEVKLASLIQKGLREEGLFADVAINGEAGRQPGARSGQSPRAPRRRRAPAVDQAVPKLDRPFGVETIETVRGAGYRMKGV